MKLIEQLAKIKESPMCPLIFESIRLMVGITSVSLTDTAVEKTLYNH